MSTYMWMAHKTSMMTYELLDRSLMMGWSEELRKPWKGCLCLCFFVCLLPSYRPQFSTQQPNFLKICSLGLWEKGFFPFFEIFIFGHFRVFSSLSFVNLLYVLQVTPIDLQTWFLAQRVFMTPLRKVFNDFWKFAFLPFLGALLFSKRVLKAKRHNCGHRDIIS